MTQVTVVRHQHQYRRSINGAWLGAGYVSEVLVIDEQRLAQLSLGSGIRVTWPDGVSESAYPGNYGVGNYSPVCIPSAGRLSPLLKRAPTTQRI